MTDQNQVLIIGGTGKTGKRVVERLKEVGRPYRLGTPNAPTPFDWYNEQTWSAVLQDCKSVYAVFYPDFSVPGGLETFEKFVKTAKQSGIEYIVLLSGRGEKESEEAEQLVISSGLAWTIVRCSWFMQNFSESFFLDDVLRGEVELPINPAVGEPFVDANDIAEVVFAALTDQKHRGQLYELTGPELLTFNEAFQRIAQATNQPISYRTVTHDEYKQGMQQAGIPEVIVNLVGYIFKEVHDGRNERLSDGVERALGRKPANFTDYVERTAASGVWDRKKQREL